MLRIAISCGEGFASGFLAARLNELAKKEHLEDAASFTKLPLPELLEQQDEFDIAMIMPHMEPKARAAEKEGKITIPMYIIPYKVITAVKAEDFIEDAEDILTLAHGRAGIFSFSDEKRTAAVSRLTSHRVWEVKHTHAARA